MPSTKLVQRSFLKGIGFQDFDPDGYGVGMGSDTRSGVAVNGLSLRADYSGITSGYWVVKHIVHSATDWLACTNGTNSLIIRFESTAWVIKETVNSAVVTDMISFTDSSGNATVVAFYGASVAFRYTVNDGTAWTASNRSGNAKYGNFGTVQRANRLAAQVAYVVNPNILYFATSMLNATAATTTTTIDDANTTASYFTSITESDAGVLLIGKRFELFSVDSAGAVISLAGPYPDPVLEAAASGPLNKRNFSDPQHLDGRVYYTVQSYDVLEYDHGTITLIAPYRVAPAYPNIRRPITAMTVVDGELFVAVSSSIAAYSTVRMLGPVVGPAGNATQLYVGQRNGGQWVWHGSLLNDSDALYISYMWFDTGTANGAPVRQLFLCNSSGTPPQYRSYITPHGTIDQVGNLSGSYAGEFALAWKLWLGMIAAPDSSQGLTVGRVRMTTTGLGALSATSPSIQLQVTPYKGNSGDSTGYVSAAVASNSQWDYGMYLPGSFGGSRLRVALIGASSGITGAAIVHGLSVEVNDFAESRRPAGIL